MGMVVDADPDEPPDCAKAGAPAASVAQSAIAAVVNFKVPRMVSLSLVPTAPKQALKVTQVRHYVMIRKAFHVEVSFPSHR